MPTTAVIIDDHADIRLLIRQIIELSGDEVTVVAEAADGMSALAALDLLDASVPTVVVTDWMMPGMDGIEVSVAIKADRPRTRIILCSAYGDPQMEQDALAAGVDVVLSKEHIADLPSRIIQLTAG
jgi:two-component system nitrate/nitrite response regulator NarL